jgi:hypothetical protein
MTEELDRFVEADEIAREELARKRMKIAELKEKNENEVRESMEKLGLSPEMEKK